VAEHQSTVARPGSRLLTLIAALAIPSVAAADDAEKTAVAAYYSELEKLGLIDVDTGTQEALAADVRVAEKLLNSGASAEAAVALYAIVESPRYSDLDEFVEYHNAEYYLGVALTRSGAHDAALEYLLRAVARGPKSLYFAPAHRRVVDIAIETRGFQGILDMLEDLSFSQPLPPGAVGERAYLRARIAYAKKDLAAAEAELSRISRKSRLYTSALYLRGIIRTRNGSFSDAADALCEVADTPDKDRFTFVVDDRYFRIKDLARLGLGRIAHEVGEYDDAYYHYFQIPEDSDRLPEALFEATWSMYQKRELGTARDLAAEFGEKFPDSPMWPEGRLLAGYVELADCEFDAAQKHYDELVAELGPIVGELDRIRKDPGLRAALFERAIERRRAERADPQKRIDRKPTSVSDRVLALLRIDPNYLKLHEAMTGLAAAEGQARLAVRAWQRLGRRLGKAEVGKIAEEDSLEKEEAADLTQLVEDTRRLSDQLVKRRQELRRAVRDETVSRDDAAAEQKRLDALAAEIDVLERDAVAAAAAADADATVKAPAGLKPMVERDLGAARALVGESNQLARELSRQADAISKAAVDKLWADTRRVLDKAKLGKIDAVIGQKRRLEIEVQDLAAGRFPPELFGKMWEKGLIGDDEEWWPFEGEFWKDEYEGFR
jgi:tetratricopeptide (TPR) repeat protein